MVTSGIQRAGEGADGLLSFLINFFFDRTFGTCSQLRVQIQLDYTSKRIFIPIEEGLKLDAMIILPVQKSGVP